MKHILAITLHHFSEFFQGFCLLFTVLILTKVFIQGSFDLTIGLPQYLIPFLGAIMLLALRKYGIIKERRAI